MFNLSVKGANGNVLRLTNNPLYVVTDISGLSPETAVINTSTVGTNDGTKYNSARINQRNIVITIYFQGDIEASRIALYSYLKSKQPCRVYYSNENRNVYIDGYVESMPCDYFSRSEFMQISIICPNPFFRNIKETVSEMSIVESLFEFPFDIPASGVDFSTLSDVALATVQNNGDISSGMIIELNASGAVVNPSIINANTLDRFDLNFSMQSGDKIIIDTIKGEKSVKLVRFGVTRNIINSIGKYPNWLQLDIGPNTFTFSADSGAENLSAIIRHNDLFEGV